MDISANASAIHQIRNYVYRTAGIIINADKGAMVISRLWRRLETLQMQTLDQYVAFVTSREGLDERNHMLDLLTTNETYFFREPAHFDRLKNQILPDLGKRPVRVWCGAASTGEEPYSIAMVLADVLGMQGWELLATDISGKVLQQARRGLYRMDRLEQMPNDYLKRFCRRGVETYQGKLVVEPELREKVQFEQHNLMQPLAGKGQFDIIFLRNVLIYFDQPTKQSVILNLLRNLRPDGWLIIGHCESLFGIDIPLMQLTPSIYRYKNARLAALQRQPA